MQFLASTLVAGLVLPLTTAPASSALARAPAPSLLATVATSVDMVVETPVSVAVKIEGLDCELRASPGETVSEAAARFVRSNNLEEDEDLIKSLEASIAFRAAGGIDKVDFSR